MKSLTVSGLLKFGVDSIVKKSRLSSVRIDESRDAFAYCANPFC